MRRPHVFERSAPRQGSAAYQEPANRAVVARTLSAPFGNMIEKAVGADLFALADLLEGARLEAEALAEPASSVGDHPKQVGPATDALERVDGDIARKRRRWVICYTAFSAQTRMLSRRISHAT